MPADVDLRVDVSGMCCPLPLIELTKAVQRLQPGQIVEIVGNDPVFESAVHDFCNTNGHSVLGVSVQPDKRVCIRIRTGGPHGG